MQQSLGRTVREFIYSSQSSAIRNSYDDYGSLLVRPGCSLPDICVVCGGRAWGNVERKEFPDDGLLAYFSSTTIGLVLNLIFGIKYLFDFPFCPECPPDAFQISPSRMDKHLAIFNGVARATLDCLPVAPPDVLAEKDRSWFERRFR